MALEALAALHSPSSPLGDGDLFAAFLLRSWCFVVGFVSAHSRDGYWGSNAIDAIDTIAKGLQQELPELRGFSARNIKNMRMFYEQWSPYINRQTTSDDLISSYTSMNYVIRQLTTAEFPIDNFMAVGFTNHVEILSKIKDFDERLFYISQCAQGSWTIDTLKCCFDQNLQQPLLWSRL